MKSDNLFDKLNNYYLILCLVKKQKLIRSCIIYTDYRIKMHNWKILKKVCYDLYFKGS